MSSLSNVCCDVLVQAALYTALHQAGITLLSIAHRPALRAFHDAVIHFEGGQLGNDDAEGWRMEVLPPPPTYVPAVATAETVQASNAEGETVQTPNGEGETIPTSNWEEQAASSSKEPSA